jgi:TPR repeat protein
MIARLGVAYALLSLMAISFAAAGPLENGLAAYQRGDYAVAASILMPLAAGGNAEAQITVGIMYYTGKGVSQDDAEAAAWYRRAADQRNAQAQNNLGVMHEKGRGVARNYAEAARWYRLAAAQGHGIAKTNLRDIEDWIRCTERLDGPSIYSCTRIIDTGKEIGGGLAEAYYQRGIRYVQVAHDAARGLADLDRAIELSPSYAEAYAARGLLAFGKGDNERAIADYDNAIRFKPDDAISYYNRGLANGRLGHRDRALADFDKAIQLNPLFAEAYGERGATFGNKGDYARALLELDRAIQLKPDLGYAYYGRGLARDAQGDTTRALDDFRAAARLIPGSDPRNGGALARIIEIEKTPAPKVKREFDWPEDEPVMKGSAPIVTSGFDEGTGALAAAPSAIHLDRRVALVIGNSLYEKSPVLRNPVNDARDVASALEKLGFDVLLKTDLDKRAMDRAFAEFASKIVEADAALFYYSGHAMELGGRNYLIPVDARLATEEDARYEMARADDVLEDIRQAKGVKIFVLDACRDNPLATALKTRSRSAGLKRGLAKIANADGILIAYATQAGDVADDGDGRNSPFTSAFLANVEAPNVEIGQVFRRIAADVSKATDGDQVPEFSISGMLPEFYLRQDSADTNYTKIYFKRYKGVFTNTDVYNREFISFLEENDGKIVYLDSSLEAMSGGGLGDPNDYVVKTCYFYNRGLNEGQHWSEYYGTLSGRVIPLPVREKGGNNTIWDNADDFENVNVTCRNSMILETIDKKFVLSHAGSGVNWVVIRGFFEVSTHHPSGALTLFKLKEREASLELRARMAQ